MNYKKPLKKISESLDEQPESNSHVGKLHCFYPKGLSEKARNSAIEANRLMDKLEKRGYVFQKFTVGAVPTQNDTKNRTV